MPRRGGRHFVLVKGAEKAMEAFKLEVAVDLGLGHLIDEDGTYQRMTTLQVGQIGGEMVRRVQAAGEWAIKQRYDNNEPRLIPGDIMPAAKSIRNVSNNGNVSPMVRQTEDHMMIADNTGQQWEPGNNTVTERLATDNTQPAH